MLNPEKGKNISRRKSYPNYYNSNEYTSRISTTSNISLEKTRIKYEQVERKRSEKYLTKLVDK